jgi:hypothetical protein
MWVGAEILLEVQIHTRTERIVKLSRSSCYLSSPYDTVKRNCKRGLDMLELDVGLSNPILKVVKVPGATKR